MRAGHEAWRGASAGWGDVPQQAGDFVDNLSAARSVPLPRWVPRLAVVPVRSFYTRKGKAILCHSINALVINVLRCAACGRLVAPKHYLGIQKEAG